MCSLKSAGPIIGPASSKRTGNPEIGQHLRDRPATGAGADYDDVVDGRARCDLCHSHVFFLYCGGAPPPPLIRRFASLTPAQRRQPAFSGDSRSPDSLLIRRFASLTPAQGRQPAFSAALRGPSPRLIRRRSAHACSAATACFQCGSRSPDSRLSGARFAHACSAATACFQCGSEGPLFTAYSALASLTPAQQANGDWDCRLRLSTDDCRPPTVFCYPQTWTNRTPMPLRFPS